MTIDPLSGFFWIWAANLFSRAIQEERLAGWLLTGLAVGCGFLAKYLNALELIAFLGFLLVVPARRRWLGKPHFWGMLAVAALCTTPVFWWNWRHGWVSATALGNRGHLNGPFELHSSTFLNFIALQAVVISPLLFVALLTVAATGLWRLIRNKIALENEGEVLLLLLFLPVFTMYAVLAWHLRCEPNWPAVSYLTLIIILAARWQKMLSSGRGYRPFIIVAFVLAWLQTLLLHDTAWLHLPRKMDPMGRVTGWSEIAAHLADLRRERHADLLIADGYKEASVFSFPQSVRGFAYTLRHSPPSNQFDIWPGYPTEAPHRALWITADTSTFALRRDFNTITFVERVIVIFHGKPFREYTVYLCENKPQP
jgi:4-amino-4-deoxy-L-arabinose transferase-like glycosyltransferase